MKFSERLYSLTSSKILSRLFPPIGSDHIKIDYADKLFTASLSILWSSVFLGYASVVFIRGLSELIELPLMTGVQNLQTIFFVTVLNFVISFWGKKVAEKKINNKKDREKEIIINNKRVILYFIGSVAISSIYFLTKCSGGFYWSPFTGYYSLIITTLSLCIRVWKGNNIDNSKQTTKATILVGVALIFVIGYSAIKDNIVLRTTQIIGTNNGLGRLEGGKIQKISDIINGFSDDPNNWEIKMVLPKTSSTKIFTIELDGILPSGKRRDLMGEIKKIYYSSDLEVAIRKLEEQSNLLAKTQKPDELAWYEPSPQMRYKLTFLFVMCASVAASLIVLRKGEVPVLYKSEDEAPN
jgi:hypothetical protein